MKYMHCRLKVLLAERDLTQRQLGQVLGLGSHTISRLVNNRFQQVDKATVHKLVNYFGCPLEGRDGLFELREDKRH